MTNSIMMPNKVSLIFCIIFNLYFTSAKIISHKKSPNALWNFKKVVECATGRSAFDYIGYGCWCGMGGEGQTVDHIDKCCQQHDFCYRRVENRYLCKEAGYFDHYNADCITVEGKKIPTCSYKNDKCEEEMCECDVIAADCFSTYPYGEKSKGEKPKCPSFWSHIKWHMLQLKFLKMPFFKFPKLKGSE